MPNPTRPSTPSDIRRAFSLAQSGLGLRLGLALGLVLLVWFAILPLVLA